MQESSTWKERLKDSSWVTIAWDWFMTLLGRVVEAALWVTMVFSCYQLIPDAPQPSLAVSTAVFIVQFVSLDVGGIGLNKLAQQQGLGTWSYTRIIAYILIGLTLVTVSYAGLQHVVPTIPRPLTNGIEVTLVVARSIMTVLYGQAIHSLKHQVRTTVETVNGLRATVVRYEDQLRAMTTGYESRLAQDEEERRAMATGYESRIAHLQEQLQAMSEQGSDHEQSDQATDYDASGLRSLHLVKRPQQKVSAETRLAQTSGGRATKSTGYVAADNGTTLAITNESGATVIATGGHRERIKQAMLQAIRNGEELDYKRIAQAAQAGYSTVKKWAPEIKQELASVIVECVNE